MPDRTITELARRQHGLVTRHQAVAAGLTRHQIAERTGRGRWTTQRPGVFVVGGAPVTWEQRMLGACLSGGPDVVASHRSALRLWGFVAAAGRLEVLVDGRRRVRLAGVTVHQSLLLPGFDQTTKASIPVTTVARTILDASARQSPDVVGGWIDDGLRRRLVDLAELRSCAARLAGPGRRDVRAARLALADRLPDYDPGDSDLEVRALRAIAAAGLPTPVQQHPIRRPDGRIARIDLAYPRSRLAIELDGWAWHNDRSTFDRDRARGNDLVLLGWTVLHFTSTTPDAELVATVAAALRATSPERRSA